MSVSLNSHFHRQNALVPTLLDAFLFYSKLFTLSQMWRYFNTLDMLYPHRFSRRALSRS